MTISNIDDIQKTFLLLSSLKQEERENASLIITSFFSNAENVQSTLQWILSDEREFLWTGFIYRQVRQWFYYLAYFDLETFPVSINLLNIFSEFIRTREFYQRYDYIQMKSMLEMMFRTNVNTVSHLYEILVEILDANQETDESTITYLINIFDLYFSSYEMHDYKQTFTQNQDIKTRCCNLITSTLTSDVLTKNIFNSILNMLVKHYTLFRHFVVKSGCINYIMQGISYEDKELSTSIFNYLASVLHCFNDDTDHISNYILENIELIIDTKTIKLISKSLELNILNVTDDFYQIIPSIISLCTIDTDSFDDLWAKYDNVRSFDLIRAHCGQICKILAEYNLELFASIISSENLLSDPKMIENILYILVVIKETIQEQTDFLLQFVEHVFNAQPSTICEVSTFIIFLSEFLYLDPSNISSKINELLVWYFSEYNNEISDIMILTLFKAIEKCDSICIFDSEQLLSIVQLILPNKTMLMYSLQSLFIYVKYQYIDTNDLAVLMEILGEIVNDVDIIEPDDLIDIDENYFNELDILDLTQPNLIPIDRMPDINISDENDAQDTDDNQFYKLSKGTLNLFTIFYVRYRKIVGEEIDELLLILHNSADNSWINELVQAYYEVNGNDEIYQMLAKNNNQN